MISAVTTAHINQLASQQNTYLPKATILEALKDRHIVMLVGACCQGKSTVVQTAPSIDPRFGMGGNLTTRPPRTDDERYSYYDHTDSGLQKLFAKIKSHELVQYAVNPTGYIYGSELNDYDHEYTVKDVLSGAVQGFRTLSFASNVAITIISKPDTWMKRVNARFPEGSEYRSGRLGEAVQSFRWSLSQPENTGTHFWVENINGHPEIATRMVIDILLGKSSGSLDARQVCTQSLTLLQETI